MEQLPGSPRLKHSRSNSEGGLLQSQTVTAKYHKILCIVLSFAQYLVG